MPVNDAASSARGFRVQHRDGEDCTTVECFGRLTSENVPLLKDAMREAYGRKGRIVLDLKEVPMMDSSGLGAVVTLASARPWNRCPRLLSRLRGKAAVGAGGIRMVTGCKR